jgi:hypothetical protein
MVDKCFNSFFYKRNSLWNILKLSKFLYCINTEVYRLVPTIRFISLDILNFF